MPKKAAPPLVQKHEYPGWKPQRCAGITVGTGNDSPAHLQAAPAPSQHILAAAALRVLHSGSAAKAELRPGAPLRYALGDTHLSKYSTPCRATNFQPGCVNQRMFPDRLRLPGQNASHQMTRSSLLRAISEKKKKKKETPLPRFCR